MEAGRVMAPSISEPPALKDLERILRLRLPVIAVIAEKKMKLGEVLNLSIGSIIQLDKRAEGHLDLLVNDQRIGCGETVRTDENFGLQVVELGSVQETIRKLGGQDEPGLAEASEDTPSEEPTEDALEEPTEGEEEPAPDQG